MFHELTDKERERIITAIKKDGHIFIVWHDNELRIKRKQALAMIRNKKYASYGFNKEGEYVFMAITDQPDENAGI